MTTARAPLTVAPARAALARYRGVLTRPGALDFFVPSAVARLGVATTGLALLFTVRTATGSFAVAGAATAAFAIAEAVVGPQTARLVDRWGQAAAIPPIVAVHVASIGTVVAVAGATPTSVTLVVVAIAGAAVPQPGALSAARWSVLLADLPALRTAFALEATVNDVVFLSGPVIATLASTALAPWSGSVIAATLVAVGCVVLSTRRATAPPRHGGRAREAVRGGGVLATRSFVAVLGVNLGLGCFFGAVPLLVTAAATARGLPALAGLVLAVSSAASIVSGIVYGSLRSTRSPRTVQLLATSTLAAAVLVGCVWPTLLGSAVMMALGGSAIAPLVASSSQIVQASVPASRRTQGFTWVNSASAAGIAVGAAVSGTMLAVSGVQAATAVLVVLVLVGVACAVPTGARRSVRDGPEDPSRT
ncbi:MULTISPECIES: MFS transporter [unclassified Curtobacterium]|uniref:MFS transporter n=1 Tax=unclassified Curtobacterium TaxID=257496 RepID=UPI00381A88E9